MIVHLNDDGNLFGLLFTCYVITFSRSNGIDDTSMAVVAFINAFYINVCDTCVPILNVFIFGNGI